MWFKTKNGMPKLRIKLIQILWYDKNGDCFDEMLVYPSENCVQTLEELGRMLPYLGTVEDENDDDKTRIFIHMDNDDMYELKMEKVSKD